MDAKADTSNTQAAQLTRAEKGDEVYARRWERVRAAFYRNWHHPNRGDNGLEKRDTKDPASLMNGGGQNEWSESEREASYGFGAQHRYPQFTGWNPQLERVLLAEWSQMNTGKSWDEAREGIRRGWDFAKQQPASAVD